VIKRIVEISNPSYLHMRHAQMVIEQDDREVGSVPIEDLGVLILDHVAIVYSQAVLVACWEANVAVVICDARHMPTAVLLPMEGHSLHSRVLQEQINASEPTCKRLWQQIVQAKIEAQAHVLKSLTGDDAPLPAYARRVRSGDPENLEAQAARIYWPRLFGSEFRRDSDGNGINALLNYGYAIIRAATARALCGAGLHPALGVQHKNQYNSFGLADDAMEPLRPLVDLRVHEITARDGAEVELDRAIKMQLLEVLNWPLTYGEASYPLLIAIHNYASSIRRVLNGEDRDLAVPRL
jgi:CRISP-associated protein Cas1